MRLCAAIDSTPEVAGDASSLVVATPSGSAAATAAERQLLRRARRCLHLAIRIRGEPFPLLLSLLSEF